MAHSGSLDDRNWVHKTAGRLIGLEEIISGSSRKSWTTSEAGAQWPATTYNGWRKER